MHELGTVFYVIQEVEKVVEENHLTQVASVTLEVGEVSGIIPYYLTDCWKWAVEKSQYLKGAELKIETRSRRDLLRGLQADISHGKIRKNMPAL
ncbi:MAG: hydrogenase maturation nickel metallochaperone HypA [Oscillospiraceae bacterium]